MNAIKHILRWNRQIKIGKHSNRESHIWVYAEWWGKRCNDNSCALANFISEKYPRIECIWITSKTTNTAGLNNTIKVVEWKTKEAEAYIHKAAVVVINQNFQDLNDEFDFSCTGAVIINLWHGVPWKKIGLDAVQAHRHIYFLYQKYVLKLQNFTGFVCPARIYENTYKRAFCLNQNQLLRAGQARNRLFYNTELVDKMPEKLKIRLGLEGKVVFICYLPTFRDSHTKPFSFTDIIDQTFQEWLEQNNIFIIQKTHTVETEIFSSDSNHIINLNDISAQELMAASDMLITDYSSCFFDYLLLDRPIIHYLYDYDYYKNKDRGLYFNKEDTICGSAPETVEDLIQAIKYNYEYPEFFHALRMIRKEKFLSYESPESCEIITQRIFEEIRKRGMNLP